MVRFVLKDMRVSVRDKLCKKRGMGASAADECPYPGAVTAGNIEPVQYRQDG